MKAKKVIEFGDDTTRAIPRCPNCAEEWSEDHKCAVTTSEQQSSSDLLTGD